MKSLGTYSGFSLCVCVSLMPFMICFFLKETETLHNFSSLHCLLSMNSQKALLLVLIVLQGKFQLKKVPTKIDISLVSFDFIRVFLSFGYEE